jgi:hypothetical protein
LLPAGVSVWKEGLMSQSVEKKSVGIGIFSD